MISYDSVVITKTAAVYDVQVNGDGPWALSVQALVLTDPDERFISFTRADGITLATIGAEYFRVDGFDAEAAALVLVRP